MKLSHLRSLADLVCAQLAFRALPMGKPSFFCPPAAAPGDPLTAALREIGPYVAPLEKYGLPLVEAA